MQEKTCSFFGHKSFTNSEELKKKLYYAIEHLITNKGVDTFLFGSQNFFDRFCLETVTKLKEKHPHIKRVYVRAEHPYIDDWYEKMLLEIFDETYYPEKIIGAGRSVYVERNYEMIKRSRYCIVYYSESEAPKTRKSGTKIAVDHAQKAGKDIIFIK